NDARHSTGGTTHDSSVRVAERASAVQDADHLDLIAVVREQNPIATMAPPMDQLPDLRAGISSYPAEPTAQAASILRALGMPCVIHQPSYSNRWVEGGLLDTLEREGIGCIAFSPLAQGMLTDRYLAGIPQDSRVARGGALRREFLSEDTLARIRGLDAIGRRRNQSLAQMALAWVLKDRRVTSAIVGASRPAQIEDSVRALEHRELSAAELAEFDRHALDAGVDLWTRARRA
ncbi:MAG: L-glyceraldehyde 3-phosphate reductase, partial [Geminicoccaceae bacterium]|nr:L-glyceraldehyde 3-phosphate reductase [Geminicoccaceae bacterium]